MVMLVVVVFMCVAEALAQSAAAVDQQLLATQLLSPNRGDWTTALIRAGTIPPEIVGPELRRALITLLERMNALEEQVRRSGTTLDRFEDPESVALVHHTVAALNDPEAITALARAMGGGTVARALIDFGEQAAPAVIEIVASPDTDVFAVLDGLRVLEYLLRGTSMDGSAEVKPLSSAVRDSIRQVVHRRLMMNNQMFSTLENAIRLTAFFKDDPEIQRLLTELANDPNAIAVRGVTDPEYIKRVQGFASGVLQRR